MLVRVESENGTQVVMYGVGDCSTTRDSDSPKTMIAYPRTTQNRLAPDRYDGLELTIPGRIVSAIDGVRLPDESLGHYIERQQTADADLLLDIGPYPEQIPDLAPALEAYDDVTKEDLRFISEASPTINP